MKTFDYAQAWRTVSVPAFLALPQNVRDLLAKVAEECRGLSQLPDRSMPWPEHSDLRRRFEEVPAEILALASRVIYTVGHWYPSGGKMPLPFPGRDHGSHWKFEHYADQVLRVKIGLAESGDHFHGKSEYSYAVHGGAIRLQFGRERRRLRQSDSMWLWRELAPATACGLAYVRVIRAGFPSLPDGRITRAIHEALDSRVSQKFDTLSLAGFESGSPFWPSLMDTDRFMCEKGDQVPPPPDPDGDRVKREKDRADMVNTAERKIADLRRDLEGDLWFFDRGLPIDNLIYYAHTGIFTFGWREPVGPVLRDRILAVISEFPFPYAIKCADGRTLEGGIG